MKKVLLTLLVLYCSVHFASAQKREIAELFDSLEYRAELQATLAGGEHNPLWLNANRYGMSSLKRANGFVRGSLERPLSYDDGRIWGVGFGLDAALAAGFTSPLLVQQAYVEGRYRKGTLTVGAKEQPMELKNPQLSSGSQTLGINAHPVPQVRVALPDYWTIPHTKEWIALKGHISYGMPTDDGWQKDFTNEESRRTTHTFLHTKAGYLKIGKEKIFVELGTEMACQFGGKMYGFSNGQPVIIENTQDVKAFWHALIPGGTGEDEHSSTYQNAEGNHLGSWLIRVTYDTDAWQIGAYADHFFEDHSSMLMLDYDGYGQDSEWNVKKESRYFRYDLRDMMLGLELKLKNNDWLQNIVVEYIGSKYQSGPVYHDHTELLSDHLGGMDNYYNHHIFTGWQHWGQVIGNPLFLSPIYNSDGQIEVRNNRLHAWHIGFSGKPIAKLTYRLLVSYQTGYGTYHAPYIPERHQLNAMSEGTYQLQSGLSVKAVIGIDSGKITGKSAGLQLSVIKTGIL